MKILITAGGTSEPIDDVRKITNRSTGKLGLAIGNRILREYPEKVEKLYYLHGETADYPADPRVEPVRIGGTAELKEKLTEILAKDSVDAVIHSMAVSDYMVDRVTTVEAIKAGVEADEITGNKISSSIDDLAIVLKRTPKIIGIIKELSPETKLVGFKLLSNVPHEELISVANALMEKNRCDFVLANDLKEIGRGSHKGYLVHRDGSVDYMETKEEIAEMIARRVMEQEA
ncbi:MAG: phosphopantothenoylcysteine decarboxylase [Lentihominibacter sp.]